MYKTISSEFFFFHKSTTLIFGSCFERNKKALTQGYGKLVSEISRNEAQK